MDKHLQTIIESAREIARNADSIETATRRDVWSKLQPDVRGKILMELRHDLEDALNAVRRLGEE